jgi:NAD(P)-dependent dehydrogenase (short-subunit alcohol dehydrogenase family)
VQLYGNVDILVNNAGIMDYNAGLATLTDDVWERVLKVNLYSVMYASRRALKYMLERGNGLIINISSVGGFAGGVAGAAYVASKHAVIGLTKNTAWIYGPKGIRCNAICPGAVKTNIMASIDQSKLDPEGSERLQLTYSLIPRVLEPEEVARAALFLASVEGQAINGQIITVDAGWTASL